MKCATCNAKIPTLASRLRKVNSELHQLGLEYHDTLSYSLNATDRILSMYGFYETDGEITTGRDGKIHLAVGEDKWLSFSWHTTESGRYEVVAYVN